MGKRLIIRNLQTTEDTTPPIVQGSVGKQIKFPVPPNIYHISLEAYEVKDPGLVSSTVWLMLEGGSVFTGFSPLTEAWQFFEQAYGSPVQPTGHIIVGGPYGFHANNADAWGFRNVIIEYEPRTPPSQIAEHEAGGGSGCDLPSAASDPLSSNPIRLRNGDKVLLETDLEVASPAEPLRLMRAYLQSKQDHAHFQGMGLGWIHNHAPKLVVTGSAPNRTAQVTLPDGGILKLDEDSGNQGHFDPKAGSSTLMDEDGTDFVLTSPDQSIRVFEPDPDPNGTGLRIQSRTWPTGDVWTYSYGATSYQLEEVADGYGRKLVFRYYTSGDHAGQLYRVGDHTFDDSGSPVTGRYVQYEYILNKVIGVGDVIVDGTDSLLAVVQDVRGKRWSYLYNQTEEDQLNFLVQRLSPPFEDAQGDPIADSEIALETLAYTLSGSDISSLIQRRGLSDSDDPATALIRNDFTFNVSGNTTQKEANSDDLVTTHLFRNGVYEGRRDPLDQESGPLFSNDYRPFAQYDSNDNATFLFWGDNGKLLQQVVDTEGNTTQFSYDSEDRLAISIDAENRQTLYYYESADNPRQPTAILVTDGINLVTNGGMEADSNWTSVASPSVNARSTTQVEVGSYARRVSGDAGDGIQSANWTMQADHNYLILARVFPVNSGDQVKMKVSGMTDFDVLSQGDGAWETLRAVYKPTSGGTKQLQFLAESTTAEFYVDSVFILEDSHLLRWQEFTYDSLGRTLTEQQIDPADGTTVLQAVERTYYNSGDGDGLLHTLTQSDIGGANDVTTTYTYDSAGRVVQTQQSSNFGACDISYTVYDAAGNVVATICNYDPGMNPAPTDAAEAEALYDDMAPDVNQVTTHAYDALGRRVRTTVNAGASFAQTSLTLYDALDRVVRTITNFVDASYEPPADWVFEGGVWKDEPSGTAISHGADNTENLIADTAYNARGLVRLQRDVLGNVALLGYDAAGRLVKTVQSASDPDYNNDYTGTAPDPDLSAYTPVSDPDQDIITEQVYDAVGNLVQRIDPLGHVHFTVYDALNRPVKTVRSAKDEATIALNPGDGGYDAADDPRSASYEPSADPDRDMIQTTEYDTMGRVVKTQRLLENRGGGEQWETTLFGYDPLGRQVKVIRSASNANYNLAADPDLSAYSPSSEPDEDLITQTVYDDNGRTLATQDVLEVATWFGYDGLGRQVKTIASAVGTATDGGVNDPRSSSYTPSSEADEDLITRTVYNSDGRVQETEDVLGNVAYFVYDDLGRQIRTIANYVTQGATDPADWEWDAGDDRWEDGAGNAILFGTDNDENRLSETVYDAQGRVEKTFDHRHNETRYSYDVLGRRVQAIQNYVNGTFSSGTPDEDVISTTEYDVAGRVISSSDNAGIETRFEYDLLGRRVQTIQNYVNGVFNPAAPDEDLISETVYNKAGQVVEAIDARGTETAFTYDAAGRRLTVTQAAGTALETVSYTGYDKAGRVRRAIQNWIDDETSPDEQDENGGWLFAPTVHGPHNDENLITEYLYDQVGRRVQTIDPVGNVTETAYDKDGQAVLMTDAEDMDTAYRYDQVRRRTLVVQNFVANGEDPSEWVWDGVTDDRWEESDGTAIAHGANNDQNVIVQVGYDKAGRMTSLRDPRGNVTAYAYDQLGRRLSLTNPLSIAWETAYSDLASGGTRTAQTLPGVNGGSSYTVQRDFDRLGRLSSIQYGDPANTPDVAFGYDAAGNRSRMTEYGAASFTSPVRETLYGYDDARRLTSVGFDTDADSSVDETVSYEYDAGGLRTKLTLPGGTDSITYSYNARGELVSLTDWEDQETRLAYDNTGRHIATLRPNGLRSRYHYDAASRLRLLRHTQGQRTLGHFAYEVDGRGNRTQAQEMLPHLVTTSDVTIAWEDDGVVYRGSWDDDVVNGFKETDSISASLKLMFFGNTASLTFGVGPDHSIFDVYIGKTLWESFDGYAAAPDERTVDIPLTAVNGNRLAGEGPHLLELRNRPEKNAASSGYSLRFKQLLIPDVAYDLHTIQYEYDALSRLLSADYHPGIHVGGTAFQEYTYGYDLAGNLVDVDSVTRTFNAANQMIHDGTNTLTYDDNGNLTSDGVNSHTWDRANRLLTAPGSTAYKYDGNGQRIQQTVSSLVTDYLLDVQPGLAVVLRDSDGTNTNHYIHAPRGVHSRFDGSDWSYYTQDGLGSVRGVVDAVAAVTQAVNYTPVGVPDTSIFGPAFTGEWRDESEVQYHRARYLSPNLGTFLSLDPFEGMASRPMSMNGYSWVEGNTPNLSDPSGGCGQPTNWWDAVDANCYWSAVGLAQRFSQGNPQAYNEWFDVLIKRSWPELKAIEALGTVNDATILPSLALREDPGLVLEALKQFSQQVLCGAGNYASLAFFAVRSGNIGLLGGSAAGTGAGLKGLIPGIAVGVGLGIGLSALLGLNAFVRALSDENNHDNDDEEFVGFHGTVQSFAGNLVEGMFDDSLSGANTPGGRSSLQFGVGIYVVKATSLSDNNASYLAEFFGFQAEQNQKSPMVVLKVYAKGFSKMSRLLHIGHQASLPKNYMTYDYIEGPITSWSGYTQVKFNPHVFPRLRLTF